MQLRPTRAIVDALTPTPESFARAAGSESTTNTEHSLYTLNASISAHFPPVKAIVPDPPTQNLHQIESLPHLQRVVLKARSQRRRLRPTVTGLKSSTNRLLLQQGHHVADMSLLTGLTYHASRRVIIAQAGVSIVQLQALLHKHGLTLPSHAAPGVNSRCVAAAFVTGAPGTLGRTESLFADGVDEVSLIDSSGRLRVFSSSVNSHLFSALRASHSLFGIIYDVTFHVVPSQKLVSVSNCFTRLTSILAHRGGALRNTVATHGGVQVVWFPYNSAGQEKPWTPQEDLVWVRMIDPPPKLRSSIVLQSSGANKSDDMSSAPPLLRFLSLPQWLTVHKMQLAKAGYSEFRREHALLFAADAFRESAWVLGARRQVVFALDATQSHHFDGVRSTRSVSVAFPTHVRHERLRLTSISSIANESVDSAESSSEPSSDSDDDFSLSDSDDATDIHEVMYSSDSFLSSKSDGWTSVHAAAVSVVRAVRSASENGGEALATTVRLSIEVTGESSAILAATRGSDGENDKHRLRCSFVILTMQAAMSAPGWDELAKGVVRSWSRLRTARWVWDRHAANIVNSALQEDRATPHVRRFLSIDRAKDVALLRHVSGVDDTGMFVDERLDRLMDGLFSKEDVSLAGSTDNGNNISSGKAPVIVNSHSLDKPTLADSMLSVTAEVSVGRTKDDNEGDTTDLACTTKDLSSAPDEPVIGARADKTEKDVLAEAACMPHEQRGFRGAEKRHWVQTVVAVFVAFWIGVYAREFMEFATTWFR